MIDYDPQTQEVFLSQELAMKFLVWAVYYNELELSEAVSFRSYESAGSPLFADPDAARLDRIKDALYKCYGPEAVAGASAQMHKARLLGEACPFSRDELNTLFGTAANQ